MLFRKKKKLRKEFDEKLIAQHNQLKSEWMNKKSLLEKSFDVSGEFVAEAKLAEAKYFYLFKEVKERGISVKGK
ncbi:YaaL family protein [Bacillus sp. B15-48]|uniref:YaaL family protein n=1 Tax=Bacillus sp. B15-48 TaxID=1548601 RepID=UPI00193ED668|nr:YaaL family protein [Bacillus sp. B15-48]MBM4765436.1 DUF2508 family protein [Bacillus sp. B15-48]